MKLQPRAITAFMVKLNSRFATFDVQRRINGYAKEPLLAILPGVALHELWSLMGTAENALSVITVIVVAAGLICMVTMLLSSLNERRREMAILRSVGARPHHVLSLFLLEAGFVSILGSILGVLMLYLGLYLALPIVEARYGLFIALNALSANDWMYLGAVVVAGFVAGLVPAVAALRMSLADGMVVRS